MSCLERAKGKRQQAALQRWMRFSQSISTACWKVYLSYSGLQHHAVAALTQSIHQPLPHDPFRASSSAMVMSPFSSNNSISA